MHNDIKNTDLEDLCSAVTNVRISKTHFPRLEPTIHSISPDGQNEPIAIVSIMLLSTTYISSQMPLHVKCGGSTQVIALGQSMFIMNAAGPCSNIEAF